MPNFKTKEHIEDKVCAKSLGLPLVFETRWSNLHLLDAVRSKQCSFIYHSEVPFEFGGWKLSWDK